MRGIARNPIATLALFAAVTACSGEVAGPVEDNFGAIWRGSFVCGEAAGVISPMLSQSGTVVSGLVRLAVDISGAPPNTGKTWSVTGTVGASGQLLLHNDGEPFAHSVTLPHGLLPNTLEITATLNDGGGRLGGTLAPCPGETGTFSADRQRFTSFK